MNAVAVVRVVASALLLALIAGNCWAEAQGALWPGLAALARQPWGVATFADLSCGLTVIAGWIVWRETRRGWIPLWLAGLLLFGNLVTLLFVLRCSLGAERIGDLVRGPRRTD